MKVCRLYLCCVDPTTVQKEGKTRLTQLLITATIPVGGEKASGWGRSNGAWGLAEYLSLKTVTVNMKKPHIYI